MVLRPKGQRWEDRLVDLVLGNVVPSRHLDPLANVLRDSCSARFYGTCVVL